MAHWYEYVPAWIAAGGTGGAFLVAAGAFRTSARDRHSAQARRAQAYLSRPVDSFDFSENGPGSISFDKYAAWHDGGMVTYDGFGHSFSIEDDAVIVYVTLSNKSPEFAHALLVTLADEDGGEVAGLRVSTIPPETDLPLIALLRPGPRMFNLAITLRFTDAAGGVWVSEEGEPVREDRTPRGRSRWRKVRRHLAR